MTDREQLAVRPFRFGLLAFIALTVLVLAAFAFILMRPRTPTRASIALDQKFAQLRKDEEPLTALEMAKSFPDPDGKHDAGQMLSSLAAGPILQGPVSKNIPVVSSASYPDRRDRVPPEIMLELTSCLTNSDAALSALPSQFQGLSFSMGWSNGFPFAASIPFVHVRQLAQGLAVKSFYEAEKQDTEKAADALRKGFGLASTLNRDTLLSTMIRVAVLGLMCEASEQVLNRTKLNDAQLLTIQKDVNPALADDFTHAHVVERYIAITAFDPIRAAFNNGGGQSAKLTLWRCFQWIRGNRKPPYRDEDYLLLLNTLDERRAAQSLPGLERLKRSEQLDAYYKTNVGSTMAEITGTHWTKATRAAVEARARLEGTKAALAVERYRLAHDGQLPDSLSALVPAFLPATPRDPLDHEPLRFKKLSRGYVVYSIGADGVDNGGAERTDHRATNKYDVTFTVER